MTQGPDVDLKGRVFTQEEVNTILSRAVERQNPAAGGLTYAELIDTARQAGIDPGAIDAAVSDLAAGREMVVEDREVDAELARRKWRSVRAFSIHFTVFVMFSVMILAIGWKNGDVFPGIVSMLAWGIGIAAHFTAMLFSTVLPNPDRVDTVRRDLRRRVERQEERDRKRERKEKPKKPERRPSAENEALKESAKELGVAVQRGMATVLSDVAKTIHEEVDRATRDGRPGPRPPVTPAVRPGVRVETKSRVGDGDDGRDDDDTYGDEGSDKRARRRP